MAMNTSEYFTHKDGCILKDEPGVHRVPIDCVTTKDLRDRIESLRVQLAGLFAENVRLKAEIYDLKTELGGR